LVVPINSGGLKIRHALASFGFITIFYFAVLIWGDSKNHVFSVLPKLISVLPVLISLSLASYIVRYLRWYWLLARAGHRTRLIPGLLAYLSGFAFTATPGKIGELIRIRYFEPMGVPSWRVLAAFVYERAFDLLAVLILASLYVNRGDVFVYVTVFVFLFLAFIVFMAVKPEILNRLAINLRALRAKRLSRIVKILCKGLSGCRLWANPLDALMAVVLGLIAWGLTSFSFVYLLGHLEIILPIQTAFSLYPLAMLAGAASMLPAGIGSTEVSIVAMLSMNGCDLGTASLAAVSIRLTTLWFSLICGFVAVAMIEYLQNNTAH
jgi:uncharacterized protein (TIRG00374 family)